MASWVEPLELETIFVSIFAGSPDIFMALALAVIAGMAGFFRMTVTTLFFFLVLFVLMFSDYAPPAILAFFAIIGGLVVGYVISKFTDR